MLHQHQSTMLRLTRILQRAFIVFFSVKEIFTYDAIFVLGNCIHFLLLSSLDPPLQFKNCKEMRTFSKLYRIKVWKTIHRITNVLSHCHKNNFCHSLYWQSLFWKAFDLRNFDQRSRIIHQQYYKTLPLGKAKNISRKIAWKCFPFSNKKMPRPGFEPGLLRPQRRVLTTRRSWLRTVVVLVSHNGLVDEAWTVCCSRLC